MEEARFGRWRYRRHFGLERDLPGMWRGGEKRDESQSRDCRLGSWEPDFSKESDSSRRLHEFTRRSRCSRARLIDPTERHDR